MVFTTLATLPRWFFYTFYRGEKYSAPLIRSAAGQAYHVMACVIRWLSSPILYHKWVGQFLKLHWQLQLCYVYMLHVSCFLLCNPRAESPSVVSAACNARIWGLAWKKNAVNSLCTQHAYATIAIENGVKFALSCFDSLRFVNTCGSAASLLSALSVPNRLRIAHATRRTVFRAASTGRLRVEALKHELGSTLKSLPAKPYNLEARQLEPLTIANSLFTIVRADPETALLDPKYPTNLPFFNFLRPLVRKLVVRSNP